MEFWEIITIGICYGLVKTRFSHWIPENLHIKAYTRRYYLNNIAHMVLFTFPYSVSRIPHVVAMLPLLYNIHV